MTVADGQPIHLVLKGTIENIPIRVLDSTGALVNATSLSLKVFDQGENLIIADDINLGYSVPPSLPTHIQHPSTGNYYFPFGDTTFDTNNDSTTPSEYLFVWSIVVGSGETLNLVQVAKVISVLTMRYIPKFRLIVDKAIKAIDDNPVDPVFVGYTDSMLIQYLEGGLSRIDSSQPWPMWGTIDAFPSIHSSILFDGALIDALTSQELFAVDTDANFSDQGNVFVIDHQPKLAAVLASVEARFASTVQAMKMHYLNSGGVHIEIGPSFRFSQLLNAAPDGALFRNAFTSTTGF